MGTKLFSVAIIIPYLVVIWLYKIYVVGISLEKVLFNIELTIIPVYLLIMVVVFLHEKIIHRKLPIYNIIISHVAFACIYALVIFIIFPMYAYDTIFMSQKDAREKLLQAYSYAVSIGDIEEQEAYVIYYNNHKDFFGEIDLVQDSFPYVPERDDRIEKNTYISEQDFYSKKVSSDYITRLNRRDILFRIKNYIEDKKFMSGRELIDDYEKIYGKDRDISFLRELLEKEYKYSDEHNNLIVDDEVKLYYQQLGYFYYLIEKKDVDRDSLLFGYVILNAFFNNASLERQEELTWIKEHILEKLTQKMFMAREARINLFHFNEDEKATFIVEDDDQLVIWVSQDVRYSPETNTSYFKELELIAFSRITRNILWHIIIPYAKLVEDRLYTDSAEISTLSVRYQAELKYIEDPLTTRTPVFLTNGSQDNIGVTAEQAYNLKPSYLFVTNRNIVQLMSLIKLWKKYYLPTNILFEHLYQLLLLTGLFLIYGLFIMRVFTKLSYAKSSFTHGTRDVIILIIGYVPIYSILETAGIFFIRMFPFMINIIFILAIVLIFILVFFLEIYRMNEIIHGYSDEANYIRRKQMESSGFNS